MKSVVKDAHSDVASTAGWAGKWLRWLVLATIAGLHLATALNREVNWDEFYFLALVHDYNRAALAHPLQTFHVHFFWWLVSFPFQEITQIVVARIVMLGLFFALLCFLYEVAKELVSEEAAYWTVVIYATFSFVVQHGSSFRADTIITMLLLGALYGFTRKEPTLLTLASSAVAVAFSGLISIKSVIYLPTIAMVLLWMFALSPRKKDLALKLGSAVLISALVFVVLFEIHANSLARAPAVMPGLTSAYQKTLVKNDLFHGLPFFEYSLKVDAVQWALIAVGIVMSAATAFRTTGGKRLRALTLLSTALPLLSIVFYRNSFPYFYVFMMAPAAMLGAAAASWMLNKSKILALLPAVMAALSVSLIGSSFGKDIVAQRSLVSAVHRLFPEPVPYIDRSSMIASFPHVGFLMSTWGMEGYRLRGRAIFARLLREKRPVFVVANDPMLVEALELGALAPQGEHSLLPEDAAELKANFLPHWGPLWVLGKTLPDTGDATGAFDIIVDGDYTLESDTKVLVDGTPVSPGTYVTLAEGPHFYQGGDAVLRFGRNLPRPDGPPPALVFTGF